VWILVAFCLGFETLFVNYSQQVLSGLAGKIPLESMTGRRVVAICNLKPAKMRGLFSYAMIFAASSETNSALH
jgi:tRNA-binding EMAP/Myf-like protein